MTATAMRASLERTHPFDLIGKRCRVPRTKEWVRAQFETTGVLLDLSHTVNCVNPRLSSEQDVKVHLAHLYKQLGEILGQVTDLDLVV